MQEQRETTTRSQEAHEENNAAEEEETTEPREQSSEDESQMEKQTPRKETRETRTPRALERIRRLTEALRERDQLPQQNKEQNTERRKWNKAIQWREEGIRNERKGYQLPKMTRETRKQVQEGLRDVWKDEIQKLLQEYQPLTDNEEQWLAFEGAIYKAEELLRTHAMRKLGRKPETMYRRQDRHYNNQERMHHQKRNQDK